MLTRHCSVVLAVAAIVFSANLASAQGDFFWSTELPGSGVVNQDLDLDVMLGDTTDIYLYWSTSGPLNSQLRVGAGLEIATSQSGIVSFESA